MRAALAKRSSKGNLRTLRVIDDAVDFSSNDYLGLARCHQQQALVHQRTQGRQQLLGATGSRLISGNLPDFPRIEAYLAQSHGRQHALVCNSGYTANLSVVSCLPVDHILYDEYIHNSLHMGLRLWERDTRQAQMFRHNDTDHLRQLLEATTTHQRPAAILVESVYSMDGDIAPLREIMDLAQEYQAVVVTDEAHGFGLFGRKGLGLVEEYYLETHPANLFTIFTYGKAAGAHGAVVCCDSQVAYDYLVNYAYPFIYSTALSPHSLETIRASYETVMSERGTHLRRRLCENIAQFRTAVSRLIRDYPTLSLIESETPIQALVIPGNENVSIFCKVMNRVSQGRITLFPIKSPTVPENLERVRIVLHSHNTREQIDQLISCIQQSLRLQSKL